MATGQIEGTRMVRCNACGEHWPEDCIVHAAARRQADCIA